jgi:hypothetical protein
MPARLLAAVLLAALALTGLAALPAPPAARASDSQISIMLDDDQLLYRGDEIRDASLKRMKALGVDYVRVSVLWEVAAENARKGAKARKRFRGEDPSTYPVGNWDRYDHLVDSAARIGIGVYFDVTGPGPSWAHAKAPRSERANQRTWKPRARDFGKFVRAVGTRYSGTYRDENENLTLPRVSFWALYNEPNQGGWLTPQYIRKGAKKIPWSPVMYRELWLQGRAGLDATGHADDVVLIGETAPLGSSGTTSKSPIRPKKFIRELFCVQSSGRRYTGGAARDRNCGALKRVKTFRTTAWAHHPYTKDLPPGTRDRSRDSITMANVSELGGLLDQMAAKTKRIAAKTKTIMTEFGYETKPPDPFSGIPLVKQAEYINEGDRLAYEDPRILGQTQFLLKDVPPVKGAKRGSKRYWFTYQSGLYNLDGSPKPAAAAYAFPLVVTRAGGKDAIWGQLRFLPNSTRTTVSLQFKPSGGEFAPVGGPVAVTNPLGFFTADVTSPGAGTWRAVYTDPATGAAATSREAATG